MTPREALHVLESMRQVQLQLAKPLAVPGLKSELARELAALRAQALRVAIDAVNDRRRRVEKAAEAKGAKERAKGPKELSL